MYIQVWLLKKEIVVPKHRFEAVLQRPEGVGTWTFLDIPFNVEEAFGSKGQAFV